MSSEMQAAIDTFVNQVTSIIRKDVMRALDSVAPKATSFASAVARGPVSNGGGNGHGPAARRVTGATGQKRDPKVLAETVRKVAEFIHAHPGLGVEQIGPNVDHTTAELALPIKKLLAEKVIVRKGHKRSTKYFPAKGGAAKA